MSASSGVAMKPLYLYASVATLAALGACNGKTDSPGTDPAGVSAPSSGNSPDNSSTKGIKPGSSGDAPPTFSAAGPSAGHTAIGGMAGGQEKGGAVSGGTPAPTAGDGTSGKPAAAAAK